MGMLVNVLFDFANTKNFTMVKNYCVSGDASFEVISLVSGDLIIIIAQIVAATQMVVEEKFVNGKNIHPLQAVGWEGITLLGEINALLQAC